MAQKKDNLPVHTDAVVTDGGTISYANEVIAIISGIAASEIEGIAGMVTAGGLGEIISKNRNITRGVKVEVGTEEVSVDLYTIVEYGQPIQKVASEVQENVRKSIESMTGLRVVHDRAAGCPGGHPCPGRQLRKGQEGSPEPAGGGQHPAHRRDRPGQEVQKESRNQGGTGA